MSSHSDSGSESSCSSDLSKGERPMLRPIIPQGSLFSSYMAAKEANSMSSLDLIHHRFILAELQQATQSLDRLSVTEKWRDTDPALSVLQAIATQRKWTQVEVEMDATILERNRLRTVLDLRSLSKTSWKQLELLPLVKDLLYIEISTDG